MSGFSPEWLRLREPADHRARDRGLAERLAAHLEGRQSIKLVDLGCGTGSNFRALSPALPAPSALAAGRSRSGAAERRARRNRQMAGRIAANRASRLPTSAAIWKQRWRRNAMS